MNTSGFALDPRLAADTLPLGQLALCQLRLMNDSRYPWVILVPQRADIREVLDLAPAEQIELWQEVHQVAAALRQAVACDKLNIATLGNVVSQLHVHVVARQQGDPAWPGPVWGHSPAQPYHDQQGMNLGQRLRRQLPAQTQ